MDPPSQGETGMGPRRKQEYADVAVSQPVPVSDSKRGSGREVVRMAMPTPNRGTLVRMRGSVSEVVRSRPPMPNLESPEKLPPSPQPQLDDTGVWAGAEGDGTAGAEGKGAAAQGEGAAGAEG